MITDDVYDGNDDDYSNSNSNYSQNDNNYNDIYISNNDDNNNKNIDENSNYCIALPYTHMSSLYFFTILIQHTDTENPFRDVGIRDPSSIRK